MIPKTIHYCWFGGAPLPPEAQACIASWRRLCPDYELIQWNESNYDVTKNRYMKDAYQARKWAFVSDYARADIVYRHGGVYLDTDVELLKPLDPFLEDGLFAGWESRDPLCDRKKIPYENSVAFGLGFGAEKGHPVLRDLLELYEGLRFYREDGTMNLTACPRYQTAVLIKYGLDDTQRTLQRLERVVIYPETVFSPKSLLTGRLTVTERTVSIHHFSMSWNERGSVRLKKLEWRLTEKIGYDGAHFIVRVLTLFYRLKKKIVGSRGA